MSRFHFHALVRRRIRRLFSGELDPAQHRALLAEVSACPACAALYECYAALEEGLCGTGPSPLAIERCGRAILAAAAPAPRPARTGRLALGMGLAGAAAALLLFTFALRRGDDRIPLQAGTRLAPVELAARGEAASTDPSVGIRLLKVQTGGAVSEPAGLSLSDIVTFTSSNTAPRPRHLALFGLQEDGHVRWYYPDRLLAPDQVDEPLGEGFRLAARHSTGWLRVTALFSDRPLGREEIEAAALRLSAEAGAADLEPLGLAGTLEHSIRVEIGPGR